MSSDRHTAHVGRAPRPGKAATSADYVRHFDAKAYLKQRFSADALLGKEGVHVQPLKFQVLCFRDFYRKISQRHSGTGSRAGVAPRYRVLEFGGGPVIYQAIVAAPYASEIIFADYCEPCRREVQQWKDKDPVAHDWSPFFHYVETEVLNGAEVSAVQLEESLRQRMMIVPCDLTQDEPVDAKHGKFDAISTSYCLESVCESKAEFEGALRKLNNLLNPGGFLGMMISLEATFYKVGVNDSKEVEKEQDLHQLYLTAADVRSSLERAGFSNIEQKSQHVAHESVITDGKKKAFFTAQKTMPSS